MFFEQYDHEPAIAVVRYAYTHVAHEGGIDLAAYPAVRAWLGRVAS
jgi:glutathione S-transferase